MRSEGNSVRGGTREENIDTEKNFTSLFTAVNRLAEKYDLLIYSDEIYTWYSYDVPFVSVLSVFPSFELIFFLRKKFRAKSFRDV